MNASRPIARDRAATGPGRLVLVAVALAATALAQAPAAPTSATQDAWLGGPDLTIQAAMMHWTRSGDRSFTDESGASVHMSVDLTLAHPSLFRAGHQQVPEELAAGDEILFFLTENIHFGDLREAPTEFRLYVDERGPFDAAEVLLINPDPHHRTHRVAFRAPSESGDPAPIVGPVTRTLMLTAIGGERPLVLSWNLDARVDEVPPLNLGSVDVIRVAATETGWAPAVIPARAGQPVILVLENPTADERQLFVHDLPIGGSLRWLAAIPGRELDDNALRAADQLDARDCGSASGPCPTGAWVHLHANPGGRDAIAFIPQAAGIYGVSNPLHADPSEVTAVVVVSPAGHAH